MQICGQVNGSICVSCVLCIDACTVWALGVDDQPYMRSARNVQDICVTGKTLMRHPSYACSTRTDWVAVTTPDQVHTAAHAALSFHRIVYNRHKRTLYALCSIAQAKNKSRQLQIMRRDGVSPACAEGMLWTKVDEAEYNRVVQLLPWIDVLMNTQTLPFVSCDCF
jgi:Fe-S-cluster-containing hydrogenase component 2